MSGTSLVALVSQGGRLADDIRARFERTSRSLGLTTHPLGDGAIIAIRGSVALGPAGLVAGDVFAPSGAPGPDLAVLCDRMAKVPVIGDQGYWGDYLTLAPMRNASGYRLSRSPFGNLTCVWSQEPSHVVAATSAPLLQAYRDGPRTVDWRRLAMFLLAPQMRNGATCVEGVRELLAGSTLEVCVGETRTGSHWSPWDFAHAACPIDSLDQAADMVGGAIDHAIAARCSNLQSVVLLLSGGLDSSTIAAALNRCGCRFSAMTMVTRHRSGDERRYARAVCAALDAPLAECLRSTADLDWDDATPRRLVRPSARLFRQPTLRAAQRLATEIGSSTIFDGGGGDDVFCSLTSVAPVLDRYAIEGLSSGVWRTARDAALRADIAMPAVIARAARRLASRRVAFRWPTVSHFLNPDVQALAREAVQHPWLDPPPGALPGQAAHVALVLDAMALAENDTLDPTMRTISVLVAQPVVEAALRVRSWLWFENGRNRAVIRRAFAHRLPPAVVQRTGKGTPGGFISELVEDHRARLRETLLDGALVARGIADPVAIESALAEGAGARDDRYPHLLALADAERWAQLWS